VAEILYSVADDYHRMARLDGGKVVEIDFEIHNKPPSNLNGIYLGRVVDIQKSLRAAFVDIGETKPGILPLHEGKLPQINSGETVLVQVTRSENPIEDKGVRLSRLITLSLGPLLYTPFKAGLSLSKRIIDRNAFKSLFDLNESEGLVVRHWARAEPQLKEMLLTLRQEWEYIQENVSYKKPVCLSPGPDMITRVMRSLNPSDSFLIDDHLMLGKTQGVATFIKKSVFDERCEEAWESLFNEEIPIPHGGSLYIEETRGLTVIDINSQGFSGHAMPINARAIKEALHQIRLRDLGGKIVIDLIDSPKILDPLIKGISLPSDTEIWGLSSMGLLEMIRRRRRLSLPQRLKLQLN